MPLILTLHRSSLDVNDFKTDLLLQCRMKVTQNFIPMGSL